MVAPPTVLVTGATGTAGRAVVARLREDGLEVRALTRNPAAGGLRHGSAVAYGDLSDPDSLRVPLRGVEAVFLVWPFAAAEGADKVLELVREHARRVVYLSSAAVRDHERQIERLVERSGLEWTVLRPHAFAANTLRWAAQIRADGVVREAYGAAVLPLVHERDVAEVAVRALVGDGLAGAVLELTGPEALAQSAQVRIIGEVSGRPVRWEEASPELTRRAMLARGWPDDAVAGILAALADLVTDPPSATSTVEEVTGSTARTFRTWVAEHVSEFRGPATVADSDSIVEEGHIR
jgi:uncharacterized protein YbjT (DUF2867 family)